MIGGLGSGLSFISGSGQAFDDVTVNGLTLVGSGITNPRLLQTNIDGLVQSTDLDTWISGTANQVTVTDDGVGGVVLSTPQNIHTGASPTFAGLTLTGLSGVLKATAGVISGSATTTDLPEGTNLYYTQSRFDTAFAAKSTTDLAEGTNLYYTDERAQDAVGGILTDTTTIDFTYNDAGATITADVKTNSISNSLIRQSAGLSVIGRSANTTGDVADITAASDFQVLRRSGTSIAFGSVNLASSNAVTGTLAQGNGGTGFSTYTLGDILYASAADTLSKLAGNTTTTKQYLSQTGNGSVSAAPAWATITGSDITGAALTKADDTNVTLALGGSHATALLSAASLTLGWTGQLAVTRGGTGLASCAQGDLFYGSAANTISALTKNTTATRYVSNTGTSNNPAWAQVDLTNGVTGDLPFANLTQGSALSVLGVTGNATADVASIAAASDHQVLRRSGTALAFGAVNLASSNAVTGILANANTTATEANTINAIVSRDSNGNFAASRIALNKGLTSDKMIEVFPNTSPAYEVLGIFSTATTMKWHVQMSSAFAFNIVESGVAIRLSMATGGEATLTGNLTISGLTASKAVFTDSNKKLTTTGTVPVDQGGTGTATTFTTGSVIYMGASAYAQSNSDFFYSSANSRFGKGTNSPASSIHLYENNSTYGLNNGLTIEQAGTGDPVHHFKVSDATFTMGINNDSILVPFVLAAGNDVRTTPALSIYSDSTINIENEFALVAGYPGFMCRAWCNFNGGANSNQAGTYSRSGTTVTVTATSHGLAAGYLVYLDFTSGAATDGVFTVITVPDANTFTVTHTVSGTTSGNVTIVKNTIRGSGNVSSVADRGVGSPSLNLSSVMPDANYAVVGMLQSDSNYAVEIDAALTDSSALLLARVPLMVTGSGGSRVDSSVVCVAIFR